MTYYLKYALKYSLILEILQKLEKKRINFFIDVQSITRGFYNKETVLVEIGRYATEGKPSDILIQEMRDFLNGLYMRFKPYDPFFVLFYDDGYCQQQKTIDSSYKSGRSTLEIMLDHDPEIELFRQIKKYYYQKIKELFTKKDLSKVYYLKEYEADFIPYYCIVNDLFDSSAADVLNVILSVDKDLLQTCTFINTVQCVTSFKSNNKGGFQIQFDIFDRDNAVCYLNKKFKRGILTANYIPMILALAGDKADNIRGIHSIGPARASEMIVDYSIPDNITDLKKCLSSLPQIIQDNFDTIVRNFKLISFEEQLKRVPKHIII
ncbi:MAG TPA: hypothetical protein PLL26_05335 [Candidatus Dojkabacteria bacterium]|nr:hypothetical protein [Candidatus Dojkabacteria bacterium]